MSRVISYSLSQDFITVLADEIEARYLDSGMDLSGLAIVFGGQRPALFLKKELAKRLKKAFYPPVFFSIDDFIDQILLQKEDFRAISGLEASFIIYNLAKKEAPDILKGRENFSLFLPWAQEILSFIEQLDLQDIKIKSLEDIQANAEIGYDVPENINLLLASIVDLRDKFHHALIKKKSYTRGLKYLLASRYIPEVSLGYRDIFFCNFFYLHSTEETIIRSLFQRQKASLFFQGDADDWSVLKNVSEGLGIKIKPETPEKPSYKLSLLPGFDLHSQVCLLRKELAKIENKNRSVVVLPDPSALIPLLSEVSSATDNYNVSIGYPLSRSSVYSLFESIFKAQESAREGTYYTKDYLRILNNPLAKNLHLNLSPSVTRILIHKAEEVLLGAEMSELSGSLFIKIDDIQESPELLSSASALINGMGEAANIKDLKGVLTNVHEMFFKQWEDVRDFGSFGRKLENFLDFLSGKSFLDRYPLNLMIVEKMFELAKEFTQASFADEDFPAEDIFKVFKNRMENEAVRFSGSPLKGLQILGILETRSLSFENVLVMDVNESVLPKLKIYEPLIPRDVMLALGLNRFEKEEEIQRYQFMRLISSAKNVFLFWQQTPEKERSRLIEELIWENQKKEKRLDVVALPQAGFSVEAVSGQTQVRKRPHYIDFLKSFRYSASSVNTYLKCPLRFYYQYVLGIEEREDYLEEPEARDVGTFIHELLEETFRSFISRRPSINSDFRKYFFDSFDKKFSREFRKKMKSDAFLLEEVMRYRLSAFLDNEESRPVKKLISIEKAFEGPIVFSSGEYRFKSKIDRIDLLDDGTLLILDYKTGSADIMPSSAEKIESKEWTRQHLKKTLRSFQLPLYFYFVEKAYPDTRLNAGLYPLKNAESGPGLKLFFKSEDDFNAKEELMSVFMAALGFICGQITDPSVPFEADLEDPYYCSTCPFSCMCR